MRTGSDPEMLVAAGYDLLILGEAARLPYEAWLQCMPMLASAGRGPEGRGGLAVLQSTPKGKNWLYREMISGNWQVWHVPIFVPNTSDRHPLANPGIGQATLKATADRCLSAASIRSGWPNSSPARGPYSATCGSEWRRCPCRRPGPSSPASTWRS